MTDDSTAVDVLSLEDFQATLASRLSDVDSVIAKFRGDLGSRPALGEFLDAKVSAWEFEGLRQQYARRLDRLRAAILAAQAATATIIANYHSTERRNHANAADIARQLDGVSAALGAATQEGANGG
jgi:methyl-accepting chemotaxis protein